MMRQYGKRRKYRKINGEEIVLQGTVNDVLDKLLKEATGEGIAETLRRLHHDEKINIKDIGEEINQLTGVRILSLTSRNQDVRRLLKRHGIENKPYQYSEEEMAAISERASKNISKSWANPEFRKRHAKRSSERMKKMNEEDWGDPQRKAKKIEEVTEGQEYYLENGGREEMRQRAKELWRDPEWRDKVLSSSWRRRDTSIEKFVEGVLRDAEVDFLANEFLEFSDGSYCFPDFRIGTSIIEVHGDFWHANPSKYSKEDLTTVQKANIERDEKKHEKYTADGYEVIYIWEEEINSHPEKAKERVLRFTIGMGVPNK